MPLVSVVMPVYNGEKYLREAVDSILSQTLTDFEFIIVDDASTDSTREIIASYNDSRIVYVKNEENLKISATLNRGIALAQGKYIARMDCDDISLPDRLEKQIAFLESHAEVALLGCSVEVFGDKIKAHKRTFSKTREALLADMVFSSALAHPSVVFRADLFKKKGMSYNGSYNGLEDYLLFWEIVKQYKASSLDECLLKYRVHQSQITSNQDKDYIIKLTQFKRAQLCDMGVSLNEKELDAFVKTACIGKNDFFGVEFENIFSAYNKILAQTRLFDSSLLCGVLTDKLIALSKMFLIDKAELKGYNLKSFSNKRLTIYSLKQLLKSILFPCLEGFNRLKTYSARRGLQNRNFTMISNNCYAGFVYQKYGLKYYTPTAGLIIFGEDYIKLCLNLKHYADSRLTFIPFESSKHYLQVKEKGPYPVAMLDDIEIYFMHYATAREAEVKWYRRCKRINYNNIVFKFSKRDIADASDVAAFSALKLQNKLCFLQEKIDGAIYVPNIDSVSGDESEYVANYFDLTDYLNQMGQTN